MMASLLSALIGVLFLFIGWEAVTLILCGSSTLVLHLGRVMLRIPFPNPGALVVFFMDDNGHWVRLVEKVWTILPVIAVIGICYLAVTPVISRVIAGKTNRRSTLHGTARWMTLQELKRTGLLRDDGGLVMGQTDDAVYVQDPKTSRWVMRRPGRIIQHQENQHTLIVGSTRSGKGVSCIIPTEFRWPGSMIIFDPKAEGWFISAAFRSRFSYTFKFDPEHPKESIHYNPLLNVRRGKNMLPDVQNLAYILLPAESAGGDPFWTDEARKLLTAIIMYVLLFEREKTFKKVYNFFTDDDSSSTAAEADSEGGEEENDANKKTLTLKKERTSTYMEQYSVPDELEERLADPDLPPKERERLEKERKHYLDEDDRENADRVRRDLYSFSVMPGKTLGSVVSTMDSKLNVIADRNVQEVTSRSDFTVDDLQFADAPVSMYLCSSSASVSRLVPLFKIIYEQITTLLCLDSQRKYRYKLLMVMDEFRQLGKMDIVEKSLALTAGFGVLFLIAIQSYEQLSVLYKSQAVFVDNFAYQVILRVNDPNTADRIEKMLGKATRQRRSASFSGNLNQIEHKGENISVQEMGRSLMDSQEIRSMPYDQCLVFASGEEPYRGKKVMYFLDDRFRKLYIDPSTGKPLPPPDLAENYPHEDLEPRSALVTEAERKAIRQAVAKGKEPPEPANKGGAPDGSPFFGCDFYDWNVIGLPVSGEADGGHMEDTGPSAAADDLRDVIGDASVDASGGEAGNGTAGMDVMPAAEAEWFDDTYGSQIAMRKALAGGKGNAGEAA